MEGGGIGEAVQTPLVQEKKNDGESQVPVVVEAARLFELLDV